MALAYPAPEALIKHCTRAPRSQTSVTNIGTRDVTDVCALLAWLDDHGSFDAYEDWVAIGMAIKLEFGDAGFPVWELVFNDRSTTAAEAPGKWESFSCEPSPGVVTLATWMKRAHVLGWKGNIRTTAASMFSGAVAQLAAGAGATLPCGLPMTGAQEALAAIGKPILDEFMAGTGAEPFRPAAAEWPQLPAACEGHGLYEPLQSVIARTIAMAEAGAFKGTRFIEVLAILHLVHPETFDAVARRIRSLGNNLPDRQIRLAAERIADKVARASMPDTWIRDIQGAIEHDNSDNVKAFLGVIGAEVRFNGWLERPEIRGHDWPQWTYIDDIVVARLMTRGDRTGTRYLPAKNFFWDRLLALASDNSVDPVLDHLTALHNSWDGVPRLTIWLTAACGVAPDLYHQAVGRNIIGGMVRRIRSPGCKHDTMAIFFGPQGTGKSSLARILAMQDDWFSDSVLLGEEAKELVLLLAGKTVVEMSEMGMRRGVGTDRIKSMVSRQYDKGRPAYARATATRARRNIFVGTTNDDKPLTDTENRRFLPVRVDRPIDLVWLRANIGQLIGEACRLAPGQCDIPESVWGIAAERQEESRADTDLEIQFEGWFAQTTFTSSAYITAQDIVELMQIAGLKGIRGPVLKKLGFIDCRVYLNGKQVRIWLRGDLTNAVRYVIGKDGNGRVQVKIG